MDITSFIDEDLHVIEGSKYVPPPDADGPILIRYY